MADAHTNDPKGAARANREFYRAFERLDLEAMHAVWLDDDSVQCVHPAGERLVGRERVLGSWAAIFRATESIAFELEDLTIEIVGDLAWVSAVERIRAGPGASARSVDPRPAGEAVATNLFVRRDGAWKLVLHHASPVARRFFPG
ncbi:MAG: nuclear transport factor 2 family protein [Planctomycetes bacterium]|nr:nuclear transport factor 2 family protein [Planctomycetota bacterium]